MAAPMTPSDRDYVLDELARVYARAAVDSWMLNENAAGSGQDHRRRKDHDNGNLTPLPADKAT
jgi:hypothetical protein